MLVRGDGDVILLVDDAGEVGAALHQRLLLFPGGTEEGLLERDPQVLGVREESLPEA